MLKCAVPRQVRRLSQTLKRVTSGHTRSSSGVPVAAMSDRKAASGKQTSIANFFGGGSSVKTAKKEQPSIKSFFGKGAGEASAGATQSRALASAGGVTEDGPSEDSGAGSARDKSADKRAGSPRQSPAKKPKPGSPAQAEAEGQGPSDGVQVFTGWDLQPKPSKGRKRLRRAGDVGDDGDGDAPAVAASAGPLPAEPMDDGEAPAAARPTEEASPAAPSPAKSPAAAPAPAAKPAATKSQPKKAAAETAPTKAAGGKKAAADEEEEEEGSDASSSSSGGSSDGASEGEEVQGPAAAGAAGGAASAQKPRKKRAKGKAKAKSGTAGVGDKSMELAAQLVKYDPLSAATWKPGEPVPYSFLADVFEDVSGETKRLIITQMLLNAFRTIIALTPEDLLPAVYLSTNQIAPSHEGKELGIGDATLMKALADATGRKEAALKADYQREGDLGTVAMSARTKQKMMFKPKPLLLRQVLEGFRSIAATEGKASVERKRGLIQKLLVSSQGCEPGYIIRSLQGKLRIGLAQQTVLAALAQAALLQEEASAGPGPGQLADRLEAAINTVKLVYSQCPSYELLVPALLAHGVAALPEHCGFAVGVPVAPMLAKPTAGVQEVLQRFSDCEFTCEYKYDGERAQVHVLADGSVRIFSRNSEDNTGRFPDIVAMMPRVVQPGVSSLVLDCEAVAYDREEKKILPFQILSSRSRKDVDLADVKVQVCLYAFDCLELNGEVLLQRPLTERREKLYSALKPEEGTMMFAQERTSRDVEELQTFLDDSIAAGTEGLIVKALDTTYEPSKRSLNWLKLKKDYMDGCGDSLDLVVIGAWYGKGKRTGVYGAFLLACWDEETEEYQGTCKIGTGFSEVELEAHAALLKELVVDECPKYYNVGEGPLVTPDVWFTPKAVWEVKCADLSISPQHKAAIGQVDPEKGIALRFPRFLNSREDKTPEMATTSAQVADMYNSQVLAGNGPQN